jgi:hypothetical protein
MLSQTGLVFPLQFDKNCHILQLNHRNKIETNLTCIENLCVQYHLGKRKNDHRYLTFQEALFLISKGIQYNTYDFLDKALDTETQQNALMGSLHDDSVFCECTGTRSLKLFIKWQIDDFEFSLQNAADHICFVINYFFPTTRIAQEIGLRCSCFQFLKKSFLVINSGLQFGTDYTLYETNIHSSHSS